MPAPQPTGGGNGTLATSLLNAISAEIIGLYIDLFGRGAGKARTQWAGPDLLVVVLEDTLTPAERRLLAIGEQERVRDLRTLVQPGESNAICATVERLTGRKVRASMSAIDTTAGVASEMFVLHPATPRQRRTRRW